VLSPEGCYRLERTVARLNAAIAPSSASPRRARPAPRRKV
jgi:hypothetical protein